MNDKPDFNSLLGRAVSETERPKPVPVGIYVLQVIGQPIFDKSSKKGTDYVAFTCKVVEPFNSESVDPDALEEWSQTKSGERRKLSDAVIRNTYYLTENSIYRLKDFLQHCGFDVDSGKESYAQMIDQIQGAQFVATIKHRQSEDGQASFAEIASTAELS